VPLVALYKEHLVHRRVLLERLEAGREAGVTKLPSGVVVGQEAAVHRGVDGLQGVARLDDNDREQVGRVVGVELGAELKVAGE